MLELRLIRLDILAFDRRLGFAAGDKDVRTPGRLEVTRSAGEIDAGYASGEDRARHGARNNVFLRLEERLNDSMRRRAARHAARYLRNHDPGKLNLRVPDAELGHGFRHLFWRRNADVGEYAAVQRFWVVKVDDVFREIGAVARNSVEVRNVRGRIQLFDECEVLLASRLDLKAVNRAIVR